MISEEKFIPASCDFFPSVPFLDRIEELVEMEIFPPSNPSSKYILDSDSDELHNLDLILCKDQVHRSFMVISLMIDANLMCNPVLMITKLINSLVQIMDNIVVPLLTNNTKIIEKALDTMRNNIVDIQPSFDRALACLVTLRLMCIESNRTRYQAALYMFQSLPLVIGPRFNTEEEFRLVWSNPYLRHYVENAEKSILKVFHNIETMTIKKSNDVADYIKREYAKIQRCQPCDLLDRAAPCVFSPIEFFVDLVMCVRRGVSSPEVVILARYRMKTNSS